jgi:hypothetical protein
MVNAALTVLILGAVLLRLLHMVRSGNRPGRTYLISLACLAVLVVLPFVWLHYALVMLIPLWILLASGRNREAAVLWLTMMLYGLPLSSTWGIWTSLPGLRSMIPLGWLAYMVRPGGGLYGTESPQEEDPACGT